MEAPQVVSYAFRVTSINGTSLDIDWPRVLSSLTKTLRNGSQIFPMSQDVGGQRGGLVKVKLNAACMRNDDPGPSSTVFLFSGSKLRTTYHVNWFQSERVRHAA